jgi:probable F420-dependent oxidoreductase
MTLRVGIGLFTGQLPTGSDRTFAQEYRETVELVRLAEAVGFDSAWVSEHHGASDGYLPSLLVMLAAFAEATTHIRLGTGVVLTPLHDPIRLAEDAAVVDQLSGGRLTIGLGIAWREEEFRMLGVPLTERLPRTLDTVEILRRAWTGRRFSFEGRAYRYEDVRVTPPPAQDGGPPILLGGYVDASLTRAGAIGDGHITDFDDADHLRHAVSLMEHGARDTGRDPSTLHLAVMANAFVGDDPEGAWTAARAGVIHQFGAYEAWAADHDTPGHDSMEPSVADEDATRGAGIWGAPADLVRGFRPVVEAHAKRTNFDLIVRLHYPGMGFDEAARAVERFGAEVIPALKGS